MAIGGGARATGSNEATTDDERLRGYIRALKKYRARLERRAEGLRSDLAEAERTDEFRRFAEALLSYLKLVPARAASATIPDPADSSRTIDIPLDSNLTPQENAARYFKRASKAERGLEEIPPRLVEVEREAREFAEFLAKIPAGDIAPPDVPGLLSGAERLIERIPPALRRSVGAPAPAKRASASGRPARPDVPARLQPRRLTSAEGWDVLIGRTNEGNDYLTHKLARPEDYWFHVHGAAGSHVVLRRGKGKNEPSKQTIEEVAAWTAFYSQARTAGKVPVIYTRKKYVRKPRGSKPGLAMCEREKSVMVRPREPGPTALR